MTKRRKRFCLGAGLIDLRFDAEILAVAGILKFKVKEVGIVW